MAANKRGGGLRRPAEERFKALYEVQPNGCWVWIGCLNSKGYGCFNFGGKGKSVLAHRWAYEQQIGAIPEGLTIDHLCRERRCVNGAHLEAVTGRVNTLRGGNAAKTICVRGHPLSGDNLKIRNDGRRVCLACRDLGY